LKNENENFSTTINNWLCKHKKDGVIMYKPNPISKLSSWLASQFDRWTAVHMLAGGSIANLL